MPRSPRRGCCHRKALCVGRSQTTGAAYHRTWRRAPRALHASRRSASLTLWPCQCSTALRRAFPASGPWWSRPWQTTSAWRVPPLHLPWRHHTGGGGRLASRPHADCCARIAFPGAWPQLLEEAGAQGQPRAVSRAGRSAQAAAGGLWHDGGGQQRQRLDAWSPRGRGWGGGWCVAQGGGGLNEAAADLGDEIWCLVEGVPEREREGRLE